MRSILIIYFFFFTSAICYSQEEKQLIIGKWRIAELKNSYNLLGQPQIDSDTLIIQFKRDGTLNYSEDKQTIKKRWKISPDRKLQIYNLKSSKNLIFSIVKLNVDTLEMIDFQVPHEGITIILTRING